MFCSRQQAREIDRRPVAEFGMTGVMLMENAGRGVADRLVKLGIAGPVVICCGGGNNGGDGFVIARHLDLRGYVVRVLLSADPGRLQGDAALNYQVLERSGVPIVPVFSELSRSEGASTAANLSKKLATEWHGAAWIVDALLGTGAVGEPRGLIAELITSINAQRVPVMAVDLPSGLDADTGIPAQHTIRAAHTCSFVFPKLGFASPGAREFTGEVHVADIGAPRKLIESVLQS